MPVPLLSTANLTAGKKEKGKHLVSFVTSKQIGVETGRVGDGCVSLRGLLRTIVLSYLLETACTVTACFGRTCLFAFDLLRAVRSALGPQVNMHSFRIEAKRRPAPLAHLGAVRLLTVGNGSFVSVSFLKSDRCKFPYEGKFLPWHFFTCLFLTHIVSHKRQKIWRSTVGLTGQSAKSHISQYSQE